MENTDKFCAIQGVGPIFEDYDNLLTAISVIKGELNYG